MRIRPLLILLLAAGALSSCTALDDYSRTYSLSLEDAAGQKAGLGVTLQPIDRSSGK